MCVQKCAHNVRTKMCVQMGKCAYKNGYFCQIFDIFVTFQKLFDRFVRTKIQHFVVKTAVFGSKLGIFGCFLVILADLCVHLCHFSNNLLIYL